MIDLTKNLVVASILTGDFGNMGALIRRMDESGADMIHLDVMDGHYVPNFTFGPPVVKSLREYTKRPLDVHLMIESPDNFADAFIDAGADLISFHPETLRHPHRLCQHIRSRNVLAGMAVTPGMPVQMIEALLPVVDYVLLMSVNPGFGGQKLLPEVLKKAPVLREMIDMGGFNIGIEIDGGVNLSTIDAVREAGFNMFVAGSCICEADDMAATIRMLRGDRA